MEKQHPQTNGGRLLKRGDTFDPECHRMTHRLRLAASILHSQGITSTHEHDEKCGRHPDELRMVMSAYRGRVCCTCGRDYKGSEWPEWVTGATFDLAFKLADEIQTERGGWHQSQASKLKEEQRAAERAAK